MTGLNHENAIFAIVVCIGITLEKNKIWKLIMSVAVVLSLSRTGWLMIGVYYIVIILNIISNYKTISKKKLYKGFIIAAMIIISTVVLYFMNDKVQNLINSIYYRITDKGSNDVSANIHLSYYLYGPEVLFFRSNIIQILFGYGIRCSGIPFSENMDILSKIGGNMNMSSAWAVETDVIGLLLGGGLITFLLYYFMGYKLIRNKNIFSNSILIILIGGTTYHFHSISYILLIFLMASVLKLRKANNEEGKLFYE